MLGVRFGGLTESMASAQQVRDEHPSFPVVGIGASAGGLASVIEVVRHLGSHPGLAVIVICPEDPGGAEGVTERIAKESPLPVCTASEGMRVERDHVYTAPLRGVLTVKDGRLRVSPRRRAKGRFRLPLDRLLESLAFDRSSCAIGVVLTGTGADGAFGVRVIRTEGGITLAQDATAEHRSMPEGAVETGCVDLVLPPKEIAGQLVRIGEQVGDARRRGDAARDEVSLQWILSALHAATGIDFARSNRTIVHRRARRRALVRGASSLGEYARLLETHRDETAALREEVWLEQIARSNHELSVANEEVRTSNEELRSTNDELTRAQQKLQATNEALAALNAELATRNREATRLGDDLTNVLSSAEVPMLILGRDGRLRRMTPAAAKLCGLGEGDLGRSIGDLTGVVEGLDLRDAIQGVMAELSPMTCPVKGGDGRWYQLTVRPYLTTDRRIDGAVLTLFDVDDARRSQRILEAARDYAQSIVDTVRAALVVLDTDLRIRSANRAFYGMTRSIPEATSGRSLRDLGGLDWNTEALRRRLESLGEGEELDGFPVERETSGTGVRSFVINARRIEGRSEILLAIEDVTEKKRAEGAAARIQRGFQQMLSGAADAILMTDEAGTIVFGNAAAAAMYGYETDALVGLSVYALTPPRLRDHHARFRAALIAPDGEFPAGGAQEVVGLRRDGTEFPIEVVLRLLHHDAGPFVVDFVRDITGRKEAEKTLHDYQRKLQEVAFDAALTEERERRRIAADLHDRIGQSLALAQIKLTGARDAVPGAARAAVEQAVELVAQSIADTRTLTFELSPPILYDLGLVPALAWLIEDIEKRYGVHVALKDDAVDKPLDDAAASLLFRAVRELLLNVFKHAKTHEATVALRRTGDWFSIEVADHGVGFNPADVAHRAGPGGFGLFSVREQMTRLGGAVDVESSAESGTRVTMRVPLRPAESRTKPVS